MVKSILVMKKEEEEEKGKKVRLMKLEKLTMKT
jgi:hypothetical protein